MEDNTINKTDDKNYVKICSVELPTEQIIENWQETGFLDGIDCQSVKENVALTYEKAAKYILNDDKIPQQVAYLIFPVIRRILTSTNIKSSYKLDVIELITLLQDNSEFLQSITSFPQIDVEAEYCAVVSDYIITKITDIDINKSLKDNWINRINKVKK